MHISLVRNFLLCLFCVLTLMISSRHNVIAQTNLEKYGQNRIQYRTFKWKYFDTKHFRIYHYDRAGRELARYVAEQVENDIAVIESKIGGKFPGRFNIILYNNYDEYKQTNIGRKNDSQLQDIPAGTVNIVGDKLVVYYTGVHTDLRRQTRAGMAQVIMERMLFGDNIREVVRNAILLNLPEWTVTGFISYIVDGWDSKSNSKWKNLIEAYPEEGFYKLAEVDPELAGKAFWKYISDRYGEGVMKSVVYTTQLKSSLNQAVKTTLNMKVKYAYDSVVNFYKDVYAKDELKQDSPDSSQALIEIDIPDDGSVIRDIRVSPGARDVAYVSWKDGEFKVYLKKTKDNKVASVILSGGKLDYGADPDINYPLLTWSNNGYKLAILYREGKDTRLRIYNGLKAQIENYLIPENRFDRVLGMTFMEDDDKMVFSAIKKSQCDLYEFRIRGKRMTNITDDAWDDVQPWFVSGGSRKGILFLSNRPEANLEVPIGVNELPTGPMNVYFYNTTTQRKELLQMTFVKKGNVSQPIQYGSENYAYLYNENGISNQYVIMLKNNSKNMDSAYSYPITNHARNIINHQYNPINNQVADVLRVGNKYKVYYKPLQFPKKNVEVKDLDPTILKKSDEEKKTSVISQTSAVLEEEMEDDEPILKRGNAFQSDFENEGNATTKKKQTAQVEEEDIESVTPQKDINSSLSFNDNITTTQVDSTYINMRAYPYKLSFKPDFVTVRLDNSVLFTRYQAADLNGNQFVNPSLGGLISVSLDDIMEDYRFTGGFRIPVDFSGTSYFLQFANHRRYVDWNVLYLRQTKLQNYLVGYFDPSTNRVIPNEQLGKTTMDLVQGSATYPLNKFESIRLHLGVRRDVLRFKAQDTLSLSYPPTDDNKIWMLSRAEYVFDNTSNPTINIYRGFRYKFFAEYLYRVNGSNGGFYNLGLDFRYYKKIYKNFTWAARLAGAHSAGNMKILYFVGGVDNWLFAKYSDFTPVRSGQDYAFQAIATNMRGYEQNFWNGNTYGVFNTEFRLPLITTFSKKPIQSAILRNLQLITFADIGSAWTGLYPKEQNIKNDQVYPAPGSFASQNSPIVVTVDDTRNAFGLGYGAGLRTMIFGYFLRLDAAFNTDNHKRKPLLHFSIGTDF